MQNLSLDGNLYFLMFIDDYTKKKLIYFVKQKSKTFEVFKKFKTLVEKESGKFIKVLRFDRGGEYKLNEFM